MKQQHAVQGLLCSSWQEPLAAIDDSRPLAPLPSADAIVMAAAVGTVVVAQC